MRRVTVISENRQRLFYSLLILNMKYSQWRRREHPAAAPSFLQQNLIMTNGMEKSVPGRLQHLQQLFAIEACWVGFH